MNLSTVEAFKNINTSSDKFIHLEGSLLRKYQLVLLDMANDIIQLCNKENINYHLGGGSALGAVRHRGFIPWDDDMDINIMGYQREFFIEKFRNEFGYKYFIQSYDTPEYGMDVSRVRLKNSICRSREDMGNDKCGFYIDIFFLENVPDNFVIRKIHGFFCLTFGFLLSCRNFYKNRILMRELEKNNSDLKKVFECKILIGHLLSFASVRRWAIMTHWCYSLCKNNHSKYVSFPAGRKHYFGEMYLREDMENTIKKNFEGKEWCVPKGYDKYFKALYGEDYMTPPPPEKREKHIVLELKFPDEYK